ncbi:hypothetical protein PoB_002568800 [Plakobranchus ocellatus]|uniref:Uncharacterized protein n=1 Tax=Plakobranchus ocellatus TaxID=259542 RepID=A0AAV3ZWF9_9GAST|nr:hypothetical protein PoB_002568800 [Plakobranchus ocellatus]
MVVNHEFTKNQTDQYEQTLDEHHHTVIAINLIPNLQLPDQLESTARVHSSSPQPESTARVHSPSPQLESTARVHSPSPQPESTARVHSPSPQSLKISPCATISCYHDIF